MRCGKGMEVPRPLEFERFLGECSGIGLGGMGVAFFRWSPAKTPVRNLFNQGESHANGIITGFVHRSA
jgi:hypothetical protein